MNPPDSKGEFSKAKNAAFRLLKIRGRSEQEMRARLELKKFTDGLIAETIQYLKSKKFIDDRQFARDWIQTRLARPFGLQRIAFELKKKGIDNELIAEELSRVKPNYPEEEVVLTLAKRCLQKYKTVDKTKRNARIFGYLSRRGFNIDSIQKAIRQL